MDSVGASLDGDVRSSSWWPSASHEHDRSKSQATEAGSPRLAPWRAEEVAHYGAHAVAVVGQRLDEHGDARAG